MSTELKTIKTCKGELNLTQYFGGNDKGTMLQLTQGLGGIFGDHDQPGFIQLTKEEARQIAKELLDWTEKT